VPPAVIAPVLQNPGFGGDLLRVALSYSMHPYRPRPVKHYGLFAGAP